MKFREYLKEQNINEADMAVAIPLISMALSLGSVFGATAGSGGKTANIFTHIKTVYKDWKINKQLKKLTPDEQKALQDEIEKAMKTLSPIPKSYVQASAKAIERKLKGAEDKEGIAKELETIQKHVSVDKLKDIKE